MQLKEAYYRRIQNEKNHVEEMKNYRKSLPLPIGSRKLGQHHYHTDDRVFQSFKVKNSVKAAKEEVKDWVDPDILEIKKKKWNISVAVPKSIEQEESQKSKLLKIKLGFSDFGPVTSNKSTKIYSGTETRDDYTNWNVSNLITQKQKSQGYIMTNLNAFDHSIKFNSEVQNYKKPIDRYRESQEVQKEQLLKQSSTLDSFQQSFLYSYPNASPERTQAVTLKFFDEIQRSKLRKKLQDQNKDQFNRNFKASLTKSQKSKISFKYHHEGKWEKIRQMREKQKDDSSDDEEYCWSCCMNNQKNSKGCIKARIDGNKPNYVAFNYDK